MQRAFVGEEVTFTAQASGRELSYRWYVRKGSTLVPLVNGDRFAGVNTASLTIAGASMDLDQAVFVCVVANPAGEARAEFTLDVLQMLPQTGDDSRLALWLGLMLLSLAGAVALRRKRAY